MNMNINEMVLDYINSKDIAKHLKKIDYQFSTPEAAFLVFRSHKYTLDEKIKAWGRIIKEMPDCSMERRMNMEAIDSMHNFLKEYIKLQNEKLKYFYNSENSVYTYAAKYEGFDRDKQSRPFSDYEKCFSALKKDTESFGEDLIDIVIKKEPLDREEDNLCTTAQLLLNKNLDIKTVEQIGLSNELFDIDSAFEGMWFRIPTPFKKGDIVIEPTQSSYTFEYNIPLVLADGIWGEDYINEFPKKSEWRKGLIARLIKNGDITDMTYNGYWLKENGFYYENGHDYLSLEYYRNPLTDEFRFLKALSMYLKNECDLDFLFDAKDIIFGEKNIKERKRCLNQLEKIIKETGIT